MTAHSIDAEQRPRVLIAPDSFKGTMSADTVATAIAEGVTAAGLEAVVQILGDGGEGTAEALRAAWGGHDVPVATTDPLGRPIVASYLLTRGGRTAVVEAAAASGITFIADDERSPKTACDATTWGTGELLAAAARSGAEEILLAVAAAAPPTEASARCSPSPNTAASTTYPLPSSAMSPPFSRMPPASTDPRKAPTKPPSNGSPADSTASRSPGHATPADDPVQAPPAGSPEPCGLSTEPTSCPASITSSTSFASTRPSPASTASSPARDAWTPRPATGRSYGVSPNEHNTTASPCGPSPETSKPPPTKYTASASQELSKLAIQKR